MFASTADVVVGARDTSSTTPTQGRALGLTLSSSGGGTEVLVIDFTDLSAYNAARTSLTAVTGQTVTINRSATGLRTQVVSENLVIGDQVDDYILVDDHARLNFDAMGDLTLAVRGRFYGTPAATQVEVGKKSGVTATNAGYQLTRTTSNTAVMGASDGTDLAVSTSAAITAGADVVLAGRLRRADNTVGIATRGVQAAPGDASAVGSVSNAVGLRFFSGGAWANFGGGSIISAALLRRALSDAQIAQLTQEIGT